MEFKGEAAGVRVYDSYAHHPNEIAGDLQAARSLAGEGRVVVAFQPHLVSRTKIFGPAMGAALGAADEVVVMDVYVAREDPEPGVNGRLVASNVPLPGEQVHFEPSWSRTPAALVERARPGDLVLTLGAGDVTLVGPEVLELLAERDPMSLFTRGEHDLDHPDDDVERTVRIARKRFVRRQWARRWLAWRLVVAAVVVLVLVAGSAWLVFASSVLAVSGVRVEGTEVLEPRAVRRAAAVPTGSPLATVDLDAITRRVKGLAAVRSVDVSRSWPSSIRIDVTEREAVAVVARGTTLRGLDATGVMFRRYHVPAARPAADPDVRERPGRRARRGGPRSRARCRRRSPAGSTTSRCAPSTPSPCGCATAASCAGGVPPTPTPRAGSSPSCCDQKASLYDVSVPGQPVIRK